VSCTTRGPGRLRTGGRWAGSTLVRMNAWMQAGLAVLGGVIAGSIGLVLFLYQHRRQREDDALDRQREALGKLRAVLLPLLIELERWLEARGIWVEGVRELRRLGTWVYDSTDNAQKAPDWGRIGELAQAAERRWWNELQVAITDPKIRALREEFYEHALEVAIPVSEPRVAATRLSECVEAILSRAGELLGSQTDVARDRPARASAPELRNPYRSVRP